MPWGLYRFHQSRLPHFITFTCYRRQSFLNTPTIRDAFLRVLERTRLRYDFLIYGFVVMPNHVHLLISEPKQGTIATVIQSMKIAAARYQKTHICPPRRADVGHKAVDHEAQATPFWQRRYYDRNVRANEEFIQALKYIHRNPVKRGLVEKPEEWQWSSYRHYALDEPGSSPSNPHGGLTNANTRQPTGISYPASLRRWNDAISARKSPAFSLQLAIVANTQAIG